MKTRIFQILLLGLITLLTLRCTKDFDEINTDPNRPTKVPTTNLIITAEKTLLDDIMDEWWSGRQSLLWSQYWAQRNYTSEDRYSIRQNVNNGYFRLIYTDMMDLEEIIRLNRNPETKVEMATYGNNQNQIAAAKILKAWAFQIMTDTYGDIPYFEAFNAETNPNPAYTPQKDIYVDLLKSLKEASDSIVEDEPVFTSGDIIYGGDPVLWKKFANSLRLRVANRLSKVTDADIVTLRNTAISEAIAAGVFESNDDNAVFRYLGEDPSFAPMYNGFYTARRNDMTVTANFVDLLKGQPDTLNGKAHPLNELVDPRLPIWVPLRSGAYRGMPYGLVDKDASNLRGVTANLYGAYNIVLSGSFAVIYMDYAEVCFILSELNGWDADWYNEGVRASMEWWGNEAKSFYGWSDSDFSDYITTVDDYMANLPPANQETVLTHKYIALYMNGYEAWAEYRRTGFPKTLIQPGEKTGPTASGTIVTFTPIVGDIIPRRLTYPVQEYTINSANVEAAAANIGGDSFATRLWWDK
jgi:hypothetical protein